MMRFVFLFAVLICAAPAFAAEGPCPGSGAEQAMCESHLDETEKTLTEAYLRFAQILPKGSRRGSYNEHTGWLKYRDEICALEKNNHGNDEAGTEAQIFCMARMNKERVVYLDESRKRFKP